MFVLFFNINRLRFVKVQLFTVNRNLVFFYIKKLYGPWTSEVHLSCHTQRVYSIFIAPIALRKYNIKYLGI